MPVTWGRGSRHTGMPDGRIPFFGGLLHIHDFETHVSIFRHTNFKRIMSRYRKWDLEYF
jgi:hypothetical protein